MRAATEEVRALTGVRFLFAFAVVVFHAQALLASLGVAEWLQRASAHGFLGVQFFFVLSGFVLCYSYPAIASKSECRAFWQARLARIYPVYLLGLLLVLPMQVASALKGVEPAATSLESGLFQVLLLQAWVPDFALTWNAPGWSLSVEAFFYLLFPLLVRGLAGRSARQVLWAAGLAYLVGQGVSLAASTADTSGFAAPAQLHNLFAYNPLLHLPAFVVGVAAAILYRSSHASLQRYRATLTYAPLVALLGLSAMFPILPRYALHNGMLAPLAACLIVGLALGGTSLSRVFSTRAFVLLGGASYSLYIVHLPILWWLTTIGGKLGIQSTAHPAAMLVLYVICSIAAAVAIFLRFEEPQRRRIREYFRSRRATGRVDMPPDEGRIQSP